MLRGFFNVCRHRAHELAPCDSTSQHRSIQCPYHGWRYGLDGTLLSTPRFEPPDGFDRAEHGLVAAHVDEWHGWIMVNAGGDAGHVDHFLDGIEPRVAEHQPERLVVGATHAYELACNWKLVVENYQECFHCPNIHPELCAVSPPASGENHDGHDGFWIGGWQALMAHAVTMSFDGSSAVQPFDTLQGPRRRQVDYLVVLPNMLVSLHPDYVMTHRLEPLAPDRTAVECQWLFSPQDARRRRLRPVVRRRLLGPHQPPGLGGVRGRAAGVLSRGYRQGPFSADEDGVAQFVRLVADSYLAGGWTR